MSEGRQDDKSDCCQQVTEPASTKPAPVQGNDPDKQMVFKVEGLTCPAVRGIGCGHMLRPVLASLDKIDGVEASSSNYTGTLIRIAVTITADRDRVAERVSKALAEKGGEPGAPGGGGLRRGGGGGGGGGGGRGGGG